jgi:hypothetical protein
MGAVFEIAMRAAAPEGTPSRRIDDRCNGALLAPPCPRGALRRGALPFFHEHFEICVKFILLPEMV